VSDIKPSEPQKLITVVLSVSEAHAILSASKNFKEQLKKIKDDGELGVGWHLLWNDWEHGHERMYNQYLDQLDKE
tara:strand:+ start:46 stop:270 length:225 start_codon:yes stop_codon:yes gene_type:complete